MKSLRQDIRYGFRQLVKSPTFTIVAVISLALGIGANTAIFSIINAVMLRSLPVEDPQRLVAVVQAVDSDSEFTNPIWEELRNNQKAFSGMLAYSNTRFDLSNGGESHFAQGLWVSGDFFHVLGVPAFQGRVFGNDDDQHGGGKAGPVAVVSYSFWKRNFPDEPTVIGKTLTLDRHRFEIIGVTPSWFTGLDVDHGFDVAIPIGCEPILHSDQSGLNNRSVWWLHILGRVAPGEDMQQAGAQLIAMAPAVFRATLPADWDQRDQKKYLQNSFAVKSVSTGFTQIGTNYRTALFVLMTIVGVVLLIACANVANLLLARAMARQREFSVRMAIGAARWRVVRQLMTESILLAVLGAGTGFFFASWGSRFLVGMLSTTKNPLEINVSPDIRVFSFTLAATFLTAVLFGLAPALRGTALDLNQSLKENSAAALQGLSRFNFGKALVAGQISLSLVLLVAAGIFLGTFYKLLAADSGFNRHNLLGMWADVQQASVAKNSRIRTYDDILKHIRALPNVVSASSSLIAPFSGEGWNQFVYPEGYVAKSRWDALVFFNRVSPEYFRTMQTPLLRGRDFSDHDNLGSAKVMIIDESTARSFFGSSDPLGKTIATDIIGKPGVKENYEVIGIVKDAKYARIDEPLRKTVYVAAAQDTDPDTFISYEIRTTGAADLVIPSIRSVVAEKNRDIALEFRSFDVLVNETLVQPRVVALLSLTFGSLALLLAMIGLYGITAYAVSRRRAEIGIRMALGAQQQDMIWLVLRDVVMLLAIGMFLGIGISLAMSRLVKSLLFGIHPNDPIQLAGAAVILALATALAAYIPARRAAKVDPMVALRYE